MNRASFVHNGSEDKLRHHFHYEKLYINAALNIKQTLGFTKK